MRKQFKRTIAALVLFIVCFTSSYAQQGENQKFTHWGAQYAADFDYIDKGMYGINMNAFGYKGIGGSFSANANFGLVDSDYASLLFKIGPNYSYALSDKLCFYAPLCVILTCTNEPTYKETHASGYFGSGTYILESSEQKFNWGFDLTPSLALKVGKVILSAGIQFSWLDGASKIGTAGMIGIGFTLK